MLALYKNIKAKRLALGMSQDELAKKTGYSDRTSISKIESGKVDLSQTKIYEFAIALNTTPGELLGFDQDENASNDFSTNSSDTVEDIKVIAAHAMSNLTEEQIKKVLEYAKFIKMTENDKE